MKEAAEQQPKAGRPDFFLFFPLAILLSLGLVMVYSASAFKSTGVYGNHMMLFWKQLAAFAVGLPAMAIAILLPPGLFRNRYLLGSGIGIVAMLLIGVQFQPAVNGAKRWFNLGPFGFQPSDFAKLVMVCFCAYVLSRKFEGKEAWRFKLLLVGGVLGLFSCLILLQPDFGTTMVLVFIVGLLFFLAGFPLRKLILISMLGLPIVGGLVWVEPYRMQRVRSFFQEEHYQNIQARLAFGAGGPFGAGVGKGTQKLHYLPEPHTDFIYATLGEEMGLIGTLLVLGSFLFLLGRGMWVLGRVDNQFLRLLGAGALLLLVTQALINISIALGLFPNKGLTLPFMSAGGSSLLLSMVTAGMLINISRFRQRDNMVVA